MRSDLPEIRSEVEHLHEWSPDDVEELRRRREAADARAGEGQVRADA
jgi:hypothetical protein